MVAQSKLPGEPEQFITILELPPVTDAQSAVKVGVSYHDQTGTEIKRECNLIFKNWISN